MPFLDYGDPAEQYLLSRDPKGSRLAQDEIYSVVKAV
jgi:hypothetical protein